MTTTLVQLAGALSHSGISFEAVICTRCGGSGKIPRFGHVLHGTCFKCNGNGQMLTRAGRAALALYEELLDAATPRIQAWELEEGQTWSYDQRGARWESCIRKDFTSTSGSLVDGRCTGSAAIRTSETTVTYVRPDTIIRVAPSDEALAKVAAEVKRRRKGASDA
jgi:hypothetical protein